MEVRADVFAAISAPARREIIARLSAGEMPVTQLAESFPMTLSAISQHLGVLKDAGLVSQRKEGRQRIYSLNAEPRREVSDWIGRYEPYWTDRLAKLGRYLEENP